MGQTSPAQALFPSTAHMVAVMDRERNKCMIQTSIDNRTLNLSSSLIRAHQFSESWPLRC